MRPPDVSFEAMLPATSIENNIPKTTNKALLSSSESLKEGCDTVTVSVLSKMTMVLFVGRVVVMQLKMVWR